MILNTTISPKLKSKLESFYDDYMDACEREIHAAIEANGESHDDAFEEYATDTMTFELFRDVCLHHLRDIRYFDIRLSWSELREEMLNDALGFNYYKEMS